MPLFFGSFTYYGTNPKMNRSPIFPKGSRGCNLPTREGRNEGRGCGWWTMIWRVRRSEAHFCCRSRCRAIDPNCYQKARGLRVEQAESSQSRWRRVDAVARVAPSSHPCIHTIEVLCTFPKLQGARNMKLILTFCAGLASVPFLVGQNKSRSFPMSIELPFGGLMFGGDIK